MFFCFFFKQKTAYDMRISDWSSDVCSSDLQPFAPDRGGSGYSPQASRAPPADLGRGRCGTHAYRAASPPARLARYVRSAIAARFRRLLCKLRSEERRVGKEGVSTCRSWWWPVH